MFRRPQGSERRAPSHLTGNGVVKVKSAYPVDETMSRLKQNIADKGIMFFTAIDQSKLAASTPLSDGGDDCLARDR